MLKAVAQTILKETRSSDVCWRYGGEEFLLLSSDCGWPNGEVMAQRIMEAVRAIRFEAHPDFSFTVSIGAISDVPYSQDTLDGYIQMADNALYTAKANGRDRLERFEQESGNLK